MNEYGISVVTPFHNVDMKYFRWAYEKFATLREDGLGFLRCTLGRKEDCK